MIEQLFLETMFGHSSMYDLRLCYLKLRLPARWDVPSTFFACCDILRLTDNAMRALLLPDQCKFFTQFCILSLKKMRSTSLTFYNSLFVSVCSILVLLWFSWFLPTKLTRVLLSNAEYIQFCMLIFNTIYGVIYSLSSWLSQITCYLHV